MARKAAKQSGPRRKAADGPVSSVIEEVRLLVQLMVDHDLSEVDITDRGREIHLKRGVPGGGVVTFAPAAPLPAATATAAQAVAGRPAHAAGAGEGPPAEHLVEIRSPMVGTFYASQSPDSDAYVSVGSPVDEDAVVCIIEAMKVMNEVKAECSGVVAEICVESAQPVEYGQVLFRVRPD